jgi:hypothetical protein
MKKEDQIVTKDQHFIHPMNDTARNERAVEMTLLFRWMAEAEGDFIEVGAVTPCYPGIQETVGIPFFKCDRNPGGYDVVDPNDKRATIAKPIADVDVKGFNVVCISTIEHIGMADWQTITDGTASVNALRQILDDAKSCFVTIPLGYNSELDKWLHKNKSKLEYFGYHKTQHENASGKIDQIWEHRASLPGTDYKFRDPFPLGNTIMIITGWKAGKRKA